MQIKLRQLEVFNALIEAGSVSRAALRLNLSQPAVSIALAKLESELGFRLFHRDRGFFAPTHEAMLLHAEVAQGLRAISLVEQRAADIRSGATGGVSIATNGVLAFNFLPRIVAGFRRDNPSIAVEIRVHSSRQIASWVGGRQIDIGLIDPPVPVAGLDARLFDLECVCVMQQDDPLAALETITPQALAGRSVIGVTGDHAVDRQLDSMLSETGTAVNRVSTTYYFAIARNLVAAGNDVAIIDAINGKAALADGVVWRPFRPRIDNQVAVITASNPQPGAAAADILERIHAGLTLAAGSAGRAARDN